MWDLVQLRFQNIPAKTWKMHQGICLSLRWVLLNTNDWILKCTVYLCVKLVCLKLKTSLMRLKCLNWQPAQRRSKQIAKSPNVKTVLVPLSHISTSAKNKMVCHGNCHFWYHPAISKPLSCYPIIRQWKRITVRAFPDQPPAQGTAGWWRRCVCQHSLLSIPVNMISCRNFSVGCHSVY